MSPRIPGANLEKVKTRCGKKRCRTRDFVLHRHHKGHQFAFVKAFMSRRQQPRYLRFVERYFEYRPEDVVHVCSSHHREIHEIYDPIIQEFKRQHGIEYLSECSWKMAEDLMGQLITRCNKWLNRSTPGAAPWPSNGNTKRRAENSAEFMALLSSVDDDIPF